MLSHEWRGGRCLWLLPQDMVGGPGNAILLTSPGQSLAFSPFIPFSTITKAPPHLCPPTLSPPPAEPVPSPPGSADLSPAPHWRPPPGKTFSRLLPARRLPQGCFLLPGAGI